MLPVGPVNPVAPVPIAPVGPVNPVAPVPIAPVGPVNPVAPVLIAPVGPVGPVRPVGPVFPSVELPPAKYGNVFHRVTPSPILTLFVSVSTANSPARRSVFADVQFAAVSCRN